MIRPLLVVVAGAPATGKTTLARDLARRLHLAILTKDDLKESLADTLGAGDRARSRELGAAAYEVMFSIARQTLEVGTGIVLEANFYKDRSEPVLRELATRADAVVVLCRAEPDVRRARFASRGERHRVHLDAEILANEWPDDDTIFAIDIGVPRIVVDTTDEPKPPLDLIEREVRRLTREAAP